MSISSHRSYRSRPYTASRDTVTNRSAVDDSRHLLPEERRKDILCIDFDFLDTLDGSETSEPYPLRVFPSLRPESLGRMSMPRVTTDVDSLKIPSGHDAVTKKSEHAAQNVAAAQQYTGPNRFNFFSSAGPSTLHVARFGDLCLPGEDVRGLFSLPTGETHGVWWLDMNSLTEGEVRTICNAFSIHPLTIEDITTREDPEKIELFPHYYFACFRSFNRVDHPEGIEYAPFCIHVVVFSEGILSFTFTPNSHATQVRKRISVLKDCVSLSSDWICYALIDDIIDSFAPALHHVEGETDAIEDEVFAIRCCDMHEFLRRIGIARKSVTDLMRLLGGKADILRSFTKRYNENYKVTPDLDIGLYLGDIQDHIVTMINSLSHCEKMLTRHQSNCLAQLSIDRMSQGNRINLALSRVIVLATVLVSLYVVCVLFGMNVPVPWQDAGNLYAFFGILGGIMLIAIVALLIARHLRYI